MSLYLCHRLVCDQHDDDSPPPAPPPPPPLTHPASTSTGAANSSSRPPKKKAKLTVQIILSCSLQSSKEATSSYHSGHIPTPFH